jgi:hypothetical protein
MGLFEHVHPKNCDRPVRESINCIMYIQSVVQVSTSAPRDYQLEAGWRQKLCNS